MAALNQTTMHPRSFLFFAFLFIGASTRLSADPAPPSDQQLRDGVVGVWYTEELPSVTQHIAQRTQYRPDGNFVSDYRISGPGKERYLRVIGTWKVEDGVFSETQSEASDSKVKIPTLTRRVVKIDADQLTIVSLDESHRSTAWRGKEAPGTEKPTVALPDQKGFVEDLRTMGVSGFHEEPVADGKVRFVLDSRKLKQPAPP